ncbi:type II toxin-antitoxin system RelE family toxin [Effusibacillus lacus]|uniref:Plasmid stabilization protein n=1 Tax=Effusibacillus lacus TaxID=1348429 RepID=A0A292YUE1_9BACL|nr:mRNA interferase RelE/StbE [Effusibacillus lacus]GAX92074.1 hypothetical protein EFBL_3765 [Effusibacillus lacus]
MGSQKFRLELSDKAEDFLKGCTRFVRERLKDALDKISRDPYNPEHSIPLVGNLSGKRRWTEGDFRVIYKVEDGNVTVYILQIGHRSNIYQKDI